MRFRRYLYHFLQDESGQAVTEYVLLLSLSLGGAIALSKAVLNAMDIFTVVFGGQLEKDLKSGGANVSVWIN